jgi:hypothetical protein
MLSSPEPSGQKTADAAWGQEASIGELADNDPMPQNEFRGKIAPVAAAVVFVSGLCMEAHGQWINYPTYVTWWRSER